MQRISTVPPLAVVAEWVIVMEFVAFVEMKSASKSAEAVTFVGENVQCEEDVAPVTVPTSVVAVVNVKLPLKICVATPLELAICTPL